MKTTDFAKHLTAFFTEYLIGERDVSPNTIRSYSESFSLLLNFLDEQVNIKADNLRLEHITRKTVLNFLDWLQDTKKSSNATRNQRLAALRSFCTYMQYEDVKRLEQWQEILSIKVKTHEKRSVNYLSIDGIKLLLAQIPINTKKGRRDLALISLLYDSGARVQELIDLTPASLKLEKPCHVTLFGKGRKKRIVPLQDEHKSRKTKSDGREKRKAIFEAKTKCAQKSRLLPPSGQNTSVVQTPFESCLNDAFLLNFLLKYHLKTHCQFSKKSYLYIVVMLPLCIPSRPHS